MRVHSFPAGDKVTQDNTRNAMERRTEVISRWWRWRVREPICKLNTRCIHGEGKGTATFFPRFFAEDSLRQKSGETVWNQEKTQGRPSTGKLESKTHWKMPLLECLFNLWRHTKSKSFRGADGEEASCCDQSKEKQSQNLILVLFRNLVQQEERQAFAKKAAGKTKVQRRDILQTAWLQEFCNRLMDVSSSFSYLLFLNILTCHSLSLRSRRRYTFSM